MSAYRQFLKSKISFRHSDAGFDLTDEMIHPALFPHQRDAVRWACSKGSAALFLAFGLGKTFVQIELARQCVRRRGGLALIVLPLGVRQEFIRDGKALGVDFKFIRRADEMDGRSYYLTNYESVRDGKLDVNLFQFASLDEASVLRSFGSKTYQTFLTLFAKVPHRFVATATPAPNRYKELIHYGAFLGAMDSGQALTRFFQRDSEKAGNLTLMPHMAQEFHVWLHSFALFVQKPSDLGYSDDGYVLPEIEVRWHEIEDMNPITTDRDGQMMMAGAAVGLKQAAHVKRESIRARVAKTAELVAQSPDDHFVIWHTLESERHEIQKAIPAVRSVWGNQDMDEREQTIVDFSDGKIRLLSTKPSIAGSGCNFQRFCHRAIFTSIDYGFNDFIQSVHRIHRFLQPVPVVIDIIHTSSEREIVHSLKRKWQEDRKLRERMSDIIKEHGLSTTGLTSELHRSIGVEREERSGALWKAVRNDCVAETAGMEADSVDLIVTSIPFGNQYEYSASYNDFGHNPDNQAFFRQLDFLSPEMLRVLKPGRVFCCHVKDRIRFGAVTGFGAPSVDAFHCDCINHYRKHGFVYFGMITVVTDVVRENNQTYRLGWSEQCKDGSKMGVGMPEYVLLFRKLQTDRTKGYADVPVEKAKDEYTRGRWQIDAHAFWRSDGDRFLRPDEFEGYGPDVIGKVFSRKSLERVYDYRAHVEVAETLDNKNRLPCTFMAVAPASHSPDVWTDVNRMRTLNTDQVRSGAEKHVCPLQFDIVDRLIERFSNKGELVYDPFGGLMTVPVRAMRLGRRGLGCELSATYFRDGVSYCEKAEMEIASPTLFDMEAIG